MTVHTPIYRWAALGVGVIILIGATVWVYSTMSSDNQANPDTDEPQVDCEITRLAEGESVSDISASGEYLVGHDADSKVLWHNGEKESLDDADFDVEVNSSGTVIGPSNEHGPITTDDPDTGAKIDGDTVTKLEASQPGKVTTGDINDNGDVVGTARDPEVEHSVADGDPMGVPQGYPMLWKEDSDEPVELEVAEGKLGYASAINDDGDILGYQVAPRGQKTEIEPWRWNDEGEAEPLPTGVINETTMAGDWVLSGGELWPLSELDDTGEVKPQEPDHNVGAIDASGTTYGNMDDEPVRQTVDGEPETLSALESDHRLASHMVHHASHDGSVLAGMFSDDGVSEREIIWNC